MKTEALPAPGCIGGKICNIQKFFLSFGAFCVIMIGSKTLIGIDRCYLPQPIPERMNALNHAYPLKREQIADGTMFSSVADSRFKTNLLTVNLILPTARETVTENALLPLVLEKCWEEAPTNRAFSRQLNRLYGASVDCASARIGGASALSLSFSAIDSAYALAGENMLAEGARILLGLLFRPVLQNGLLEEENLALQKQYLADTILADINEKRSYALGQTLQRMFEGEPCGLPRYGFLEDIEKITPAAATAAWKRILDTARVEIFHVGMGDPSGAKALFSEAFRGKQRHPLPLALFSGHTPPASPREFREEKPVAQSKLCMGFAAGSGPATAADLSAMRLMTAVFGGTPTSRLFVNVREKRSLCYYCAARYDRFKGALIVDSGVEHDKAEETKAAILEELEAVRRGEFTGEELDFARLSLQNTYRSVGDSAYGLESFYLGQSLLGLEETPEDQGEQIAAVTREAVCEAANRLVLDTVYLLAGSGEGENTCENQ